MKLVFAASLLTMQLQGVRAKTGWLKISIMCLEWSDMSTRELLFLWASFIKIQFSVLVLYKADIIIISLNVIHSRHDIVKNLLILALSNNWNNNRSLTCLDDGKKNNYFLRVQFVIRQNFGVSVLPSAEFELSLKYIYKGTWVVEWNSPIQSSKWTF